MKTITKAAIIGGGVIGAGWVARLLENGITVSIFDPDPQADRKVNAVVNNADRAYQQLSTAPRRPRGEIIWCASVGEAVTAAQIIIESVPEQLETKRAVYAEIEADTASDALIASSTSGIMPSDLQSEMMCPERLLVCHPFNPFNFLPVVELVAGRQTSEAAMDQAAVFLTFIGMHPLRVNKEIPAFIADRLLEAVWREALWLVKDDIATTRDIDEVIRLGFGLRWAQMGLFETYRIAGGEAGMHHFLSQFGPCLKWPWTKLMDVPELDQVLIDKIAEQSDRQSGAYTIRQLEKHRDDNLIAIMRTLKVRDWGAGKILAGYEQELKAVAQADREDLSPASESAPVKTLTRTIPGGWTDYNGHMNESYYLRCFSRATDRMMELIGADAEYIERKGSYFTVETHLCHLGEAHAGQLIEVTTQVIDATGKKLHLFQRMFDESGQLLATGEHLLIHVSLDTRHASNPDPDISRRAQAFADAHAHLPQPEGLGRAVGQHP